MNPADPLEQLRDIHLPEAVSWWPPAPLWWVLATLVLLGLAALSWVALNRWRRNAYRRSAHLELLATYRQWQQQQDGATYLQQLNEILKRTALCSFPTGEVASLSGKPWCEFLDARLRSPGPSTLASGVLATHCYGQRPMDQQEIIELQAAALHWLAHHRSLP